MYPTNRNTRALSKIKRFGFLLLSFGFDPRKTLRALRSVAYFVKTYLEYTRKSEQPFRGSFVFSPILGEQLEQAGAISDDYFALDLWAAQTTKNLHPSRHLDVGSRLDGYVAHILTFSTLDVLDIRNLKSNVKGLNFIQGDGRFLQEIGDNTYDLVSSLHAIEHFGLGRYGDPIDPLGHLMAIRAFARVTRNGGYILLGFPTGFGEIMFNAQRLLMLEEVIAEVPGRVVKLVKTVGDGSMEEINQNFTDYSCVGVLFQISK
jgi:hypothetical protein